MTKQKGKLTFKDPDDQSNMNLLEAAKMVEVKKFIYVFVLMSRVKGV